MSEWFKKSERPPEEGAEILVASSDSFGTEVNEIYLGIYADGRFKNYETGCGCCSCDPDFEWWTYAPQMPAELRERLEAERRAAFEKYREETKDRPPTESLASALTKEDLLDSQYTISVSDETRAALQGMTIHGAVAKIDGKAFDVDLKRLFRMMT